MPRLYVACLASYNNGVLHGEWIDATTDEGEMMEDISKILLSSPFPNVMVNCPTCEGSGEGTVRNVDTGEDHDCECQWCGGTGRVSSAEEWAFHDHEGLGNLGEYASLSDVVKRVEIHEIAEKMGIPTHVAQKYADEYDVETLQDNYRGEFTSWADFAEDFATECGDVENLPEWVRYYVDWESLGRDHEINGGLTNIDDHFFYTF